MSLPSIALHAKNHNIIPKRQFGQNFIFDSTLCDKIALSSGSNEGTTVLEVGPGPAGLTRSILATKPSKLIVIEKDQRCLSLLKEVATQYPALSIIVGDALSLQLKDICSPGEKLKIISNLPYNIGTELIFKWLEQIEYIDSVTVMLQKEVVERICATHNSKIYGKLSVMCQIMTAAKKKFDVSPKAFYPQPKVSSAIVTLTPLQNIPDKALTEEVRRIAHHAFTLRRKMIKSSLDFVPDEIFSELAIHKTSRAENLSPQDYLSLGQKLLNLQKI